MGVGGYWHSSNGDVPAMMRLSAKPYHTILTTQSHAPIGGWRMSRTHGVNFRALIRASR
jgi:hypothetical protein